MTATINARSIHLKRQSTAWNPVSFSQSICWFSSDLRGSASRRIFAAQLVAEEVHQQVVMPVPVRAALVAAHDAYGAKAHSFVCA